MFPTSKKFDDLFATLSSTGAYIGMVNFFQQMCDAEEDELRNAAVGALTNPDLCPLAQRQLGRRDMARDILAHFQRFQHRSEK